MYRQTTTPDGTTTITCQHCTQTRRFRTDLMLRRWKLDQHPQECPARRRDNGGAA